MCYSPLNGILFSQKNIVLIHITTWINLENITLSEKPDTKGNYMVRFHLYDMSRTDESLGSSLPLTVDQWLPRAGSVRKGYGIWVEMMKISEISGSCLTT